MLHDYTLSAGAYFNIMYITSRGHFQISMKILNTIWFPVVEYTLRLGMNMKHHYDITRSTVLTIFYTDSLWSSTASRLLHAQIEFSRVHNNIIT